MNSSEKNHKETQAVRFNSATLISLVAALIYDGNIEQSVETAAKLCNAGFQKAKQLNAKNR